MVIIEFTDEQKLIKKMIVDFSEKKLTREVLKQIDETGIFPEEIINEMSKLGLFALKAPKEYGGVGVDTLTYVLAMEEMSKYSAVASIYLATPNSLSTGPLLMDGTDEQKQKYIKEIASGEKKLSFALTESQAGSDAGGVTTTAKKEENYYILNGRKTFITMAPIADYAIVYAKTDVTMGTKGISAFIVDLKSDGVTVGKEEDKMGVIGCPTGDIILKNVKVPVTNLLGKENDGFRTAMKTLNTGRLGVAAQSVGVAQAALNETIQYSKDRQQFGKPICEFQSISFTIADMATKIECARSLLYRAAKIQDRKLVAMAKYYCAEICNEVCGKALQIHGGYGFIKGYKIERLYRDCRVFTIYEGTSQIQQMIISRELLK